MKMKLLEEFCAYGIDYVTAWFEKAEKHNNELLFFYTTEED